MFSWCSAIAAIILLIIFAWKLLVKRHRQRQRCPSHRYKAVVALGLGGHIREMYEILKSLDASKYEFRFICDIDDNLTMESFRDRFLQLARPKTEAMSPATDGISEARVEEIFYKVSVPKSIGTSKVTAAITTVQSFLQSLVLLYRIGPDIVITNGPGIAVPLCYAALFLKVLLLSDTKIAYIESYCRVENLSYSGRLVYYIADIFIVLWPQLAAKYPGARYMGNEIKL